MCKYEYEYEYEKKVLLDKKEFDCLLETFLVKRQASHTNFYYDTDSFDGNRQGVTCRIRKENGVYTATMKHHGVLSDECSREISMVVNDEWDGRLFEGLQVSLKGSMITERHWIVDEDGLEAVLDRNTYLWYTDYELEIEYVPEKENEATQLFKSIIQVLHPDSSDDTYSDYECRAKLTQNKSQRWVKRALENLKPTETDFIEKPDELSLHRLVATQNANRLLGIEHTTARRFTRTKEDIVEPTMIHPSFVVQRMGGVHAITKDDIQRLHTQGSKITFVYETGQRKRTEKQGRYAAKHIIRAASKLGVPKGTAIFLLVNHDETISREYMSGFAGLLLEAQYTPGFKLKIQGNHRFVSQFEDGMQTNATTLRKCLLWAVEPFVTGHDPIKIERFSHPENWPSFVSSDVVQRQIAIWQYGKDCCVTYLCPRVEKNKTNLKTTHLHLVRNPQTIIEKMF